MTRIMKIKTKNKRGFSLVEVLFALLVLSIGVASIAALMAGNIKTAVVAKDQVIAAELAQEGIELVVNLKSNKDIGGSFTTETSSNASYHVDINDNFAQFISSASSSFPDQVLNLKDEHYLHTSAGVETKFHRRISLTVTAPPNGSVNVTSQVAWGGSFPADCNMGNRCVSVDAVLPDQN